MHNSLITVSRSVSGTTELTSNQRQKHQRLMCVCIYSVCLKSLTAESQPSEFQQNLGTYCTRGVYFAQRTCPARCAAFVVQMMVIPVCAFCTNVSTTCAECSCRNDCGQRTDEQPLRNLEQDILCSRLAQLIVCAGHGGGFWGRPGVVRTADWAGCSRTCSIMEQTATYYIRLLKITVKSSTTSK